MDLRFMAVLGLVAAIAACGVFAAPASAQQLAPGEIVVADSLANPNGDAATGTIFRVDPATGVASILAEPSDFVQPRGIAIDGDGNVIVADPLTDPNGGAAGTGAVFKIVPGQAPTVITSALFDLPTGVDVNAAGDILVADTNANPEGLITPTGSILRIPAGGGPAVVFESDDAFGDPWDVAVDGGGDVLVADRDAAGGALLRFTPGQDAEIFVGGFDDPSGVGVGPSGEILVADPDATAPGRPPNTGEVSLVSQAGVETPLLSTGFDDPFGAAVDSQGRALIADGTADPNGAANGTGAIFRFVPGQAPAALSASTMFVRPAAVDVMPGGAPPQTPIQPPQTDSGPTGQRAAALKKCKKKKTSKAKRKCRKKAKKLPV